MLKQYNFNPNIREVVCKNVKKYRKEKNIRLMDLSEAINVTPDYIRRMESDRGIKNISLTTLYKIATVLDVSMDKFFEE